jgi:hypothetical protein
MRRAEDDCWLLRLLFEPRGICDENVALLTADVLDKDMDLDPERSAGRI